MNTEEPQFKYLAIKNWAKYQPDKKLIHKDARLPWIKDYTDREDDAEFYKLTMFQRGVLEGLCRLVGRTPSRLIHNDPTYVSQALHAHPTDRSHIGHALLTLTSRGFLLPCNQQIVEEIDEKSGRELRVENRDVRVEDEPKEGMKEGRKEKASFASLTTPDGVPSESDQDCCKHDGGKLTCYQWLTTRWSDRDTAEQVVHQIMSLWHDLTNNWNNDPETEEAIARAVQHQDNALTISHTMRGVLVTYADKFKSHGQPIAWRDLKFFLEPNRYDLNARKVRALDAARAAKAESAPTKPVLHNSPRSGYFSIGKDSVCCDCGAEGQNVTGGVRCQDCINKFECTHPRADGKKSCPDCGLIWGSARSGGGGSYERNMDFEAEAV